MTDPKNDHSNDLSLEMDYKSGDDSVPPSGKFPKDAIRGSDYHCGSDCVFCAI